MVVKVLAKQISLNSIRVILEVYVVKNPTCFSRWSVSYAEKYFNNLKYYFDNNSDVLTIDNHFNVNNQEFMLEISPIKLVRIVNIETGKKFRCNERNFLDQVSFLKS